MDQLTAKVDEEERSAACPLDEFSKEDLIRLIGDYSGERAASSFTQ